MSIFGATDTPVLDFWEHLLWVSKPEWATLFTLGGGVRVLLRFTSIVTLLPVYMAIIFILGRAKLCYNFSNLLRDGSDIHRFPTVHMVKIRILLENLRISESSFGILEYTNVAQLSPMKYNCAVLF